MNPFSPRPITDGGLRGLGTDTLEEMYSWIMKHILLQETRKDPYSVACIYCYLYLKEHETDRLTTLLGMCPLWNFPG